MIKVENVLKGYCNGEQTVDALLSTIENLIKHEGIKPEFVLSEIDKENNKASLSPNVIDAIKLRIDAVSGTRDSKHKKLTGEFDDTIDYADTQDESDALCEPPRRSETRDSSFNLEQDTKSSSKTNEQFSNTGAELLGVTLNKRYELVTQIGSGGRGSVYKAIDRKLLKAGFNSPNVAIKILHRSLDTHKDGLHLLQNEVKRYQKLNHPGIVDVYGANQDGTFTYLVMEYLNGQSLQDKMAAAGFSGLPLDEAYPVIRAMGKALAFAHESGIVHYDFKPSNIFITDDDQVKVIDFGIAKAVSEIKEVEGAVPVATAITPTYASPEMLERCPPDPRDDIYAFACTTYELLTGSHPFGRKRATEARAMGLQAKPPKELSPPQWQALEQALEFDRHKRTNNLAMLVEDMTHHESLWPSNSIFIRGIAASIVLSVSVSGVYLASARQNSDVLIDPSAIPLQPIATPIARASPMPDSNPVITEHDVTKVANDSVDFASIREFVQQTELPNDSETQTQDSIPSSTRSSVASPISTDPNVDSLEKIHHNSATPTLISKSTKASSETPNRRDYTSGQVSRGTHETVSSQHISEPASAIAQAFEPHRVKSEPEKLYRQFTKLATLHKEGLISGEKDSERDRRLHQITDPSSTSPSLFLNTISKGDVRAVQSALDSGVSADTRIRSSGINALMLAASNGHREIVESLIRANADINAQDKRLRTALLWAAGKGHVKVLMQLLDHGASPNLRDKYGETALIHATWSGHDAVVQRLVERGTEINIRNKQGFTALTIAAINGHTSIVSTLLDAGANPNLVAHNGQTALMAAAWNGHADVVRLLSVQDGQIDATSANGWTALTSAAWNGHATIVKDLIKAGADPIIKDNNQMSAIDAAEAQGFKDIADFLRKIKEK